MARSAPVERSGGALCSIGALRREFLSKNVGCSVSPSFYTSTALFNLCAQILCMELKKNTEIQPVMINEEEQLLDQYADDTDVFSVHDQSSLTAIEKTLTKFGDNIGLRISYEKTTIYRIGSLKDTDASLYTMKPIAWTNEGINMLGVLVRHHNIKVNYKEVLNKAQSVLNLWRQRDLTLMGRVTILNSLVASLFVHKLMVLPTPSDVILQKIDSLITNFVWNGKQARIKLSTLQMLKKDGGLQLFHMKTRDIALKITWVQILEHDPVCCHIGMAIASPIMKKDIFKCSFAPEDVQYVIPANANQFWKDVLKAWAMYNYTQQTMEEQNQCIWMNSMIRISGKPFLWEQPYKKGLFWITDLYPEGCLIKAVTAQDKYDLTLMQLNMLVSAIPGDWRQRCKDGQLTETTVYDKALACKNLSQVAYAKLLPVTSAAMNLADRWSADSGTSITQDQNPASLQKNIYFYQHSEIPKLSIQTAA